MSKPKAAFQVGQTVQLKKSVSENYDGPDKWSGSLVTVVALVLNRDEYLYQLRHEDGSEAIFEEIEISKRKKRK